MSKPFQLQSLLDLSNLRLDEAAQQLGKLIAGEQEAGQRLELLVQYRDEYQVRFSAAASNGIGPDAWRNYQYFLERLDQAIEQARAIVDTSKQHTAAGQRNWLDKRGKVKAFDTLAERHSARANYADARQEQKQSDEHSARRYGVATEEE
ncbi:MAG: flagellar export protein FliJ [Gammaproteobacteria bacterium]|nr:flagellar export protein FliJ [Rhodocyclaceae bacterium]MBU3909540.1 flagellar export protein FliJ [Gammaproteobacteria bacterium]MBU3989130.1 flagellar export protein FliJ [Gammaproteobacteria bacterium]MBU4003203.1 flagellar export protein FliJ [Gammaproteobacteria bacterium]MBU4022252.1 flagellar export protein FliJ [Gammaproteobacteria bacterium]